MSNDSKKLLTLGNVEIIKDYIDTTSSNIKYYIDEEFKAGVNTKIQEATTAINNSFNEKTAEINNKINLLEQTTGNKDEINKLQLQLDAVKADNDAMNTALNALSAELEAGLNDVSGSILSAGQINDLVNTALINSVNISSDAVEAPTVYTQNLVALIGKFGQIKATNIVGSEISGKTVKSTNGSWELNNNGAGTLANGNITWTEDGVVTFGPNVKLNWSNIEGSDDAADGVEAAMNAATAAANAAATAQATANEATALANEAKNSIPSEERITEITRNSITTENITGTTISGKTIKSTDDKWELNSNGAGKLANGNITWTEDGVVTFSDDVELKWGNITDTPNILTEDDKDDIVQTVITESGITADTIVGKTIKSVDDGKYWMIDKDGTGHLAGGRIIWDEYGKLTCNMDSGSVDGSQLVNTALLNRIAEALYDSVILNNINSSLFIGKGIKLSCGVSYCINENACYLYDTNTSATGFFKNVRIAKGLTDKRISLKINLTRVSGTTSYSEVGLYIDLKSLNDVISDTQYIVKDIYDDDTTVKVISKSISLKRNDNENLNKYFKNINITPPALEDLLLGDTYYVKYELEFITDEEISKIDEVGLSPAGFEDFITDINTSPMGLFYLDIDMGIEYTRQRKTDNEDITTNKIVNIQIPIILT